MLDILSHCDSDVLRSWVSSNVLLAFDYDGTLAPIVDDPADAFMSTATRELMWQLAQRYPVIVISGRAQPDALQRLRGVGLLEVVGNHGIEPRHAANRYVEQVRRWSYALDACVSALSGVVVEDKIYSLAVHYRHASDKIAARAAILETATALGDARVLGGKDVVNLVPRDAVDKGAALKREQERLHCGAAIYVGDDETDEDVFVRAPQERVLGIRVGFKPDSAATYFIRDQSAVDELLQVLIDLRPGAEHGRSR